MSQLDELILPKDNCAFMSLSIPKASSEQEIAWRHGSGEVTGKHHSSVVSIMEQRQTLQTTSYVVAKKECAPVFRTWMLSMGSTIPWAAMNTVINSDRTTMICTCRRDVLKWYVICYGLVFFLNIDRVRKGLIGFDRVWIKIGLSRKNRHSAKYR